MADQFSTLTTEEALRAIAREMVSVRAALERSAPAELLWTTFPEDGGLEPMVAGTHVFDLSSGKVDSPDKRRILSTDVSILKKAQSGVIIVDSPLFVRMEPGVGKFALDVNAPVFSSGRQIHRVEIVSSYPFLMAAVFGTHWAPPTIPFWVMGQARLTDTTLVKTSGANIADGFQSLAFVPQMGTKTLDQALWGQKIIPTVTVGQKTYVFRNLSASSVEWRIQGTIYLSTALVLEAAGSTGFVNDPDVHTGGDATLFTTTLLQTTTKQTNFQWGAMRIQARIAAAAAAGATARVIVEYAGLSGMVR